MACCCSVTPHHSEDPTAPGPLTSTHTSPAQGSAKEQWGSAREMGFRQMSAMVLWHRRSWAEQSSYAACQPLALILPQNAAQVRAE